MSADAGAVTTPGTETVETALRNAIADMRAGRHRAAIERLGRLHSALPAQLPIARLLGLAHLGAGACDAGRGVLGAGRLALDPANWMAIGECREKSDRDAADGRDYRRAHLLDPARPDAPAAAARGWPPSGFAAAAPLFRLVRRLAALAGSAREPAAVAALAAVARRLERRGEPEVALDWARAAAVLAPGQDDRGVSLVRLFEDAGERAAGLRWRTRLACFVGPEPSPALADTLTEHDLIAWRGKGPPHVETAEQVTVDVCRAGPGAATAVFEAAGGPVAAARLLWNTRVFVGLRPADREPQAVAGEAVFGGYVVDQFGHFLIETCSRLWYLRGRPDARSVWLGPLSLSDPAAAPGLLPWQVELFDLLGFRRDRMTLVDRALRFDRMVVPEAGAVLRHYLHPLQAEALAVRPFGPRRPGHRVWLSRTGLGRGTIANEAELEAGLLARGWRILHPETLSVTGQLDALAGAERIAGFGGSALHALLLFAGVDARIDVVSRDNRGLPAFEMIARTKALNQRVHFPKMVRVRSSSDPRAFAIADPGTLIASLD